MGSLSIWHWLIVILGVSALLANGRNLFRDTGRQYRSRRSSPYRSTGVVETSESHSTGRWFPQTLLAIIVFAAAWELIASQSAAYVFPSLATIAMRLPELRWTEMWSTISATLSGFAVAMVIAALLHAGAQRAAPVRSIASLLSQAFGLLMSTPLILLASIPRFGIGWTTVVIVSACGAFSKAIAEKSIGEAVQPALQTGLLWCLLAEAFTGRSGVGNLMVQSIQMFDMAEFYAAGFAALALAAASRAVLLVVPHRLTGSRR